MKRGLAKNRHTKCFGHIIRHWRRESKAGEREVDSETSVNITSPGGRTTDASPSESTTKSRDREF